MPGSRLLTAIAFIGLLAASAYAADAPARRNACLSKAEQRAAVAGHRAVPLADAIKALQRHRHGIDVVRARLCRHGEGLAYVLTLLSRSGKVTRATVDAASGELINGR